MSISTLLSKLPKYHPGGPVEFWLWAALTEFVNGFIAGLGGGSVMGIGTGVVTTTTNIGEKLSAVEHTLAAIGACLLAASGNGVKRVIVWHNSNPFPNPFPQPDKPAAPLGFGTTSKP